MTANAGETERVLAALGNPVRREMLRLMLGGSVPVGQLASQLPVSRPAVSKHLRLLEEAGLVRREARGTQNYCSLRTEGFRAAHTWLAQFWDEALGLFKPLAENTNPRRKRA